MPNVQVSSISSNIPHLIVFVCMCVCVCMFVCVYVCVCVFVCVFLFLNILKFNLFLVHQHRSCQIQGPATPSVPQGVNLILRFRDQSSRDFFLTTLSNWREACAFGFL